MSDQPADHPLSTPKLSCQRCRGRKTKCDRRLPRCSPCVDSGNECFYPARAVSKSRKSRDARIQELRCRLVQLEEILSHPVGGTSGDQNDTPESVSGISSSGIPESGRLKPYGLATRYHSVYHWATVGTQVADSSALLDSLQDGPGTPSEDDAASIDANTTPISFGDSPLSPFGEQHASTKQDLDNIFSQPALCESLFGRFINITNATMQLFHKDTLQYKFAEFMGTRRAECRLGPSMADTSSRNSARRVGVAEASFEAVLSALFLSTVTSTKDESFFSNLGMSREHIQSRLRKTTRVALNRARYLQSPTIESLQAMVLYLHCHYMETPLDGSCWPVVGMAIRLAQSMGLHRDPLHLHTTISVVEIEIRRRLWFHICGLDQISAQFHGPRPTIRIDDFDTQLPRNIDDADLSYEASVGSRRVPDGGRFTDMTVILIRMSTIRCFMTLDQLSRELFSAKDDPYGTDDPSQSKNDGSPNSQFESHRMEKMETVIKETIARHEQEYLRFCNTENPVQRTTRFLGSVIETKLWVFHFKLMSGLAKHLGQILKVEDRREHLSRSLTLLEIMQGGFPAEMAWECCWLHSGILQLHALSQLLTELAPQAFGIDPLPDEQILGRCFKYIDLSNFERNGAVWATLRRVLAAVRRIRNDGPSPPFSSLQDIEINDNTELGNTRSVADQDPWISTSEQASDWEWFCQVMDENTILSMCPLQQADWREAFP